MAAANARSAAGATKWVAVALLMLFLVGVLVWAGTQAQVDAVRPADLKYLTENKAKPGVITTASGLEYEVLSPGKGESPIASDTVAVNYEGRLVDGTVFDSSYARGQPAVFRLDQVIPGWTEGVQLMKPGAKYRFTIPPQLGYGARGAGDTIPPNAVLIFDVELLAVKPR